MGTVIDRHDRVDVVGVELRVGLPQPVLVEVVLHIQTLEVVEERLEDLLVENQEVLDEFLLVENGDAIILCKLLLDFFLLPLIHKDPWPPNPVRFHQRSALL